jgi:RNA polymerase sigma-70 factor, ECF subfamily
MNQFTSFYVNEQVETLVGREKTGRRNMFFSKSVAIDQEEFNNVALPNNETVGSSVDTVFLERLRAGESNAFDILINRYSGDIYTLLFRLTENEEDARDLTQETFLSAIKAVHKFRGDADLKTWLYRIAINESRNRFRWWKRRKVDVTFSLDEDENPLSEKIHSTSENPEMATLRRERENLLRKALQQLPSKFKEVVILRDIEGFSYEEIANALETNVGTVKSRIARGREELRKKLTF